MKIEIDIPDEALSCKGHCFEPRTGLCQFCKLDVHMFKYIQKEIQ